ncbi:NAD(P)-binding protein [Setomelanomma holmii]|uniref:NAD(P)-binding protein n=1 Tax=Setomelanomma holmii TaxID=210430 RepID=A0A9P4LQ74_9PLEO|nr:NAD(P)-binding protein [Setomelanomma holmii]
MSKTLVVIGATGQQGGSVVDAVLKDAQLSKEYTIRGTTRDPNQLSAQALAKRGIEVVKADINDATSLKKAFEGAHVVFANTITIYDGHTYSHEIAQGHALADAAVAAGVPYYIWSTLPNAGKISGGKLKNMGHFDGKEEVEQYVRTLPLKSAFFAPGSFMSNFSDSMAPHPVGDGTYAVFNFVSPETRLPLIDAAGDTGKWIIAILADFVEYEGKALYAATGLYTYSEVVQAMSKASGKEVAYKQIPEEDWRGFLPLTMKDHVAEIMTYMQNYGYFGEDMEEKVKWAADQARGRLTTLEEYFLANPLKLE